VGKHETGYPRIPRDDYPSPAWVVTDALAKHINLRGLSVWEFACGKEGRMAKALKSAGCARVHASDIGNGYADQNEVFDLLALLLPHDFDSAKTRERVFRDCPHFAGKITLLQRVKWFEHPDQPRRNPKENTDWCLWSRPDPHVHRLPNILYAPNQGGQHG
jgi:hypothetical protein